MPTSVTATTYTPSSNNAWNSIDASAVVPSGASGIYGYIKGGGDQTGVRKNGSTDTALGYVGTSVYIPVSIGVDASRIFQMYKTSGDAPQFVLTAYWTTAEGATFLTNGSSFTTSGSAGTWADTNAASIAPSAVAVFGTFPTGNNSGFVVRIKGSTDSRIIDTGNAQFGAFFVAVDGSQLFQSAAVDVSVTFYVVGYITSTAGLTSSTNGVAVTPGSTGSYVSMTAIPGTPTFGVFENPSGGSAGLRSHADSVSDYYAAGAPAKYWIVPCDGSGLVDAKISSTSLAKVYRTGYFSSAGGGGSVLLLNSRLSGGMREMTGHIS